MKVTVVEISGYQSAICAMYMTNRNLTPERRDDIKRVVEQATTRYGFINDDAPLEIRGAFLDYLEKTITYGLKHEHWQILKFINVHIMIEGLHRGAQDDYDAHAKRMEIIRSTTRTAKGANHAEFSDFYKGKIMTFDEMMVKSCGAGLQKVVYINDSDQTWIKKPWGYVLERYQNDPDVVRGLTGLGMASDNLSMVPYGEHLQHIYDLRRHNPRGKEANPELRLAMEMMRDELLLKCYPLGHYLGKVWVESGGGHYAERNECKMVWDGDEI